MSITIACGAAGYTGGPFVGRPGRVNVQPVDPHRLTRSGSSRTSTFRSSVPAALCEASPIDAVIRKYKQSDEEPVVGLSLRAWEPVFSAVEKMLGGELFLRLRGDWRAGQAKEVRAVLGDPTQRVWVAEFSEKPIGFVTARRGDDGGVGEIYMIAVDPDAQGRGVGTALTDVATDWLRQSGMRVAMIETGGDPGHAPARRVYEKAGYTALPAVRFFKAL